MNHQYDKENYEMQDFLKSIGYNNIYMGGYEQLELVFVPKGQMFCIHEYDGFETIETPESMGMIIAEWGVREVSESGENYRNNFICDR